MVQTTMARERLFALRAQIARLEGHAAPALAAEARAVALKACLDAGEAKANAGAQDYTPVPDRFPFRIPALDHALEGGLPLKAISEIRAESHRDAGAASGLALAISACLRARHSRASLAEAPPPEGRAAPGASLHAGQPLVLWISDRFCSREDGRPYTIGLEGFGLPPSALIEARPRRLEEALFAAEAALQSGLFCATILEIAGNPKGFGLTESRRLSLRAKAAGRPLLLLRLSGAEEAGSTALRIQVAAAPAQARRLPDGALLAGSLGNPVFRLTLEKSRLPAPSTFLLEWNPDACQFLPAAAPDAIRKRPAHSGAVPALSGHRPASPPRQAGRVRHG